MRLHRGRGARSALAAALLGSVAAACGAPEPELPERFARRFLPFDPQWIPESRIPAEPQESPMMVIWELTETVAEPGPEEREAARDWVERCYDAARRHGWHDVRKGLADGYELPPHDPRHYRNVEYLLDDRILDPDRPEFLMYYKTPDGGRGLAGFMFTMPNLVDRGPQFAGRLSIWHYHVWKAPRCVVRDVVSVGFAPRGEACARGEPRHRSEEMIHTWLIDHPRGPFATSMLLPPEIVVAGLEKRKRERGF